MLGAQTACKRSRLSLWENLISSNLLHPNKRPSSLKLTSLDTKIRLLEPPQGIIMGYGETKLKNNEELIEICSLLTKSFLSLTK